jgi:DNA-directed RNA polymerase specialized sigma24 family protein
VVDNVKSDLILVDGVSPRDDLVQEIALAIWKAIPRFRGDSSERTWVYRIAHNVAITSATGKPPGFA